MELLKYPGTDAITCVDMHTGGEPARIICSGFPSLQGTLLEQLAEARSKYDHLRRRVMLEPRGHEAMHGAVLCPETELTKSGDADIGVLFMHNGDFFPMCGHVTIALGRFLVDTHDPKIFPRRQNLRFEPAAQVTRVRLHASCGLLDVSIPTKPDGLSSDPSKPVSFISTESFASAVQTVVDIPESDRWPELDSRTYVTLDVSFGGAFHIIVSAKELGFSDGLRGIDFKAAELASKMLKATINEDKELRSHLLHATPHTDLPFIQTVMIVDNETGDKLPGTDGAETGLCFVAQQQVDRSPTGSVVQSRVALAYAKGLLKLGQSWTYNSVISNTFGGSGAMAGKVKEIGIDTNSGSKGILVEVSGQAFYTGMHSFMFEEGDVISKDGFDFQGLFAT